MSLSHDVHIWKLTVRKDRRQGYGVRWGVAGHQFSKWFATRALADNHRAGLLQAVRKGEAFDTDSGLPESAARAQRSVTWYDLACQFTDMKWPHLAAKSRISIADALATITPALVTTTRGMPDRQVLRGALYGWAFNKERRAAAEPGPDHATAIDWIKASSLKVTALDEKARRSELIRAALDALALTMDGQPRRRHRRGPQASGLLQRSRLRRRARHPARQPHRQGPLEDPGHRRPGRPARRRAARRAVRRTLSAARAAARSAGRQRRRPSS